VLWRHGQTTWNVEQRFQGQTDIPLDETGEAQAEYAARRLATLGPHAIVASDLSRAQQTAAPLSRLTGLQVIPDKELRERFGGDWEGLSDEEIRERYPAERATWNPPNGEPTSAVADRMSNALIRIAGALGGGQLAVVVSHGAALRLGIERVLGLPAQGVSILGPLANCSWSVLSLKEARWRLLEYNAQNVPEPVIGDDR
jgi:glucosyl-3-phosphoglycerate phosphatase